MGIKYLKKGYEVQEEGELYRDQNCDWLATKFSELVTSLSLVFCPITKENRDTTFVFKSFY